MLREISISFLKQKICKPFGNADSLPDFQKAKGFENEVRKEVYRVCRSLPSIYINFLKRATTSSWVASLGLPG